MASNAQKLANSAPASTSLTPTAPAASPQVLTVGRTQADLPLPLMMKKVATDYGKSFNQMMVEIAKLGFGTGKLSVEEYFDLRLFDDAALNGADKRQFLGLSVMGTYWSQANYDESWMGVIEDKLASTTLLSGYGFPVIPIAAIYAPSMKLQNPAFKVLKSAADLRAFMMQSDNYPMFCKPTNALQSLGSVSFTGVDAASGMLAKVVGAPVKLDDFIADVMANYEGRYLFQKRLDPHAAIRAVCGDRLATVRLVTINPKSGPEIFRAAWKIPAGENSADNFWRPGNLLAQLDMETGVVKRVVRSAGLKQDNIETHPDTGVNLIGFQLPFWKEAKALACDAMQTWKSVGLIGWDMAITDKGPVIVEPNLTPDFILPQIAERRGILDDRFQAFLTEQKASAAAEKAARKANYADVMRASSKQAMAGLTKG
jgi:hypothetical protein